MDLVCSHVFFLGLSENFGARKGRKRQAHELVAWAIMIAGCSRVPTCPNRLLEDVIGTLEEPASGTLWSFVT